MLDNPLFILYNIIMKKLTKPSKHILKKVRSRTNQDILYTYTHWAPKEIDGVQFIPVVKNPPSDHQTQVLHYMRKDSLEYIK